MENHQQYNLPAIPTTIPPESFSAPNVERTDKTWNVKNFHILSDIEFETKKGQKFGRTVFSTLLTGSVYSAAATDYLIGVTSLSYAPIIGLPRPKLVGVGKTFIVKDETGGAATTTITVRSAGEETIDGSATATLNVNYSSKSFYTDGANWFIY